MMLDKWVKRGPQLAQSLVLKQLRPLCRYCSVAVVVAASAAGSILRRYGGGGGGDSRRSRLRRSVRVALPHLVTLPPMLTFLSFGCVLCPRVRGSWKEESSRSGIIMKLI